MHALFLSALLAAAPANQPSVYTLDGDAFLGTARRDLDTLKFFVTGLHKVFDQVAANKKLFSTKSKSVYTPEQKRTILTTWGALFSYFSAAEGLREKYWDFVKLSPADRRHAWGFVITHTALTAVLAYGLAFTDLTLNNPQLETLFDEPNGEFGVPAGAFAAFKKKAVHVSTSTQLVTGDTWAVTVFPVMEQAKAGDDDAVDWAWSEMRTDSKSAKAALTRHGAKLFMGNTKDVVQDSAAGAVFPAQKTFAEWMGDTRVARVGKPLISRELLDAEALPKLQPGDVLVARQNWFLSNIGLPGFWPHALLYVGTPKDVAASLDADPAVQAWAQAQPEKAMSLSELLLKRYPEKFDRWANKPDFQGHAPIRVIESISEGVSFTAVEHAFGVDYLAALRPRLPAVEKARAIERAFHYQGRPYDFDFDFFSDSTLVCTELVYKSYQPAAGMKGLSVALVDVAGRRTLPANELIKLFDAEADVPTRQLDFVFFLDASEKETKAFPSDAKALRQSWKRLKWDVAQK